MNGLHNNEYLPGSGCYGTANFCRARKWRKKKEESNSGMLVGVNLCFLFLCLVF